mmetsp:Transcript_3451/g.9963  ORF Transcript_3451/g.9963 Transcript_3451/m.9963 type:complete len:283 (+) Transcript_3451:185-1033(+)
MAHQPPTRTALGGPKDHDLEMAEKGLEHRFASGPPTVREERAEADNALPLPFELRVQSRLDGLRHLGKIICRLHRVHDEFLRERLEPRIAIIMKHAHRLAPGKLQERRANRLPGILEGFRSLPQGYECGVRVPCEPRRLHLQPVPFLWLRLRSVGVDGVGDPHRKLGERSLLLFVRRQNLLPHGSVLFPRLFHLVLQRLQPRQDRPHIDAAIVAVQRRRRDGLGGRALGRLRCLSARRLRNRATEVDEHSGPPCVGEPAHAEHRRRLAASRSRRGHLLYGCC